MRCVDTKVRAARGVAITRSDELTRSSERTMPHGRLRS
jgi:hypothetical protein